MKLLYFLRGYRVAFKQTERERNDFNILFRDERGREKKSSMIMIFKQVYRTNSFSLLFS